MTTPPLTPTDSPQARAERLRRLRNLANLTRQSLCEGTDLNANTLKGWEISRYGGLTAKGAEKVIARVAEEGVYCTLDWLLYDIGAGPRVITDYAKSEQSVVSAALPRLTDEQEAIAAELLLFRQHYQHAVDWIVNDDGMLPHYPVGDYVAGVPRFPLNTIVGEVCIVQTEEGQRFLRLVRAGREKHRYTLVCTHLDTTLTEPILYDVKLTSAAPVIWQRHPLR